MMVTDDLVPIWPHLSRYGKFHYKYKMVIRRSYVCNGNHCTSEMASLCWDGPLYFPPKYWKGTPIIQKIILKASIVRSNFYLYSNFAVVVLLMIMLLLSMLYLELIVLVLQNMFPIFNLIASFHYPNSAYQYDIIYSEQFPEFLLMRNLKQNLYIQNDNFRRHTKMQQ